jgi:hypothetical protein
MAERAGATISEVEGSHVIMISQPQEVADVILRELKDVEQPTNERKERSSCSKVFGFPRSTLPRPRSLRHVRPKPRGVFEDLLGFFHKRTRH